MYRIERSVLCMLKKVKKDKPIKEKKANINFKSKDTFFAPIKYIVLGLIAIINVIKNFLMYICLGSYYFVLYVFVKPFRAIKNSIQNLIYSLTPKQVKKEKELKLEVNFDESGVEEKKEEQKNIGEQIRVNQKKL